MVCVCRGGGEDRHGYERAGDKGKKEVMTQGQRERKAGQVAAGVDEMQREERRTWDAENHERQNRITEFT